MSVEADMHSFTLLQLIEEFGGIRIPMIQRDYAQGRESWNYQRERFLNHLRQALLPDDKPDDSLQLDFVYGTTQEEDGISAFCPLDGQQRLTTLFLLHWYLAMREGRFTAFRASFRHESGASRFCYQVRPGGRAFFDALVRLEPPEVPVEQPSAWIRNTPWFRSVWEQDPTVAGALVMLDALHACFKGTGDGSCYDRLVRDRRITFRVLDLRSLGLHDDLYLRMNARGKELSEWETFKARYEKHLDGEFPDASMLERCEVKTPNQFAQEIDGDWLDFFWKPAQDEPVAVVDNSLMNLFRSVALVSLNQAETGAEAVKGQIEALAERRAGFDDFEKGGWLGKYFTARVIFLLEAWWGRKGKSFPLLGENPWFDECELIEKLAADTVQLTLTDYLQFAAYIGFIERHGPSLTDANTAAFPEWMRVVRNLTVNSRVGGERFLDFLDALETLAEHSLDILAYLANKKLVSAFNEQQVKEEHLKAALILGDARWRKAIEGAENHGYFQGQIEFLLVFSGVREQDKENRVSGWITERHTDYLEKFAYYFERAEAMFDKEGLRNEEGFLWERALLAIGDYLLPDQSRWSFLDNAASSHVSWKRFLRGGEDVVKKRLFLKTLWDRMEGESRKEIAADTGSLLPWRRVLCVNVDAWEYCEKRCIRRDALEEPIRKVFLLNRQRRRSAYAELFTYHLSKTEKMDEQKEKFSPLVFERMEEYCGNSDDPHLQFSVDYKGNALTFGLYGQYRDDNGFSLWVAAKDLDETLRNHLLKNGFQSDENEWFFRRQEPGDPCDGATFLRDCAAVLASIPKP